MPELFEVLPERKPKFLAREKIVLTLVVVQSLFLYGDPGITVPGVASAVLLVLLVIGGLIGKESILPRAGRLRNILVFFLGLTALGIGIGYFRGNELLDIAKDFMKFGNLFLIAPFLRRPLEAEEVLRLVKWVLAIIYIPAVLSFLGKVDVKVPYFIASVDYGNQCVPIVLIIVAGVLFKFQRVISLVAVLSFLPLFTLIVSGTWTYWIGTLSGFAVLYFLNFWHSSGQSGRGFFFLVGVLAICIYVAIAGLPFGSVGILSESQRLEQRLQLFKERRMAEEQSVDGRLDETEKVIQSIKNWVSGNGLGEIVLIDTKEGLGPWDFVPSTWFHNAYLFFLLKMGLIGLGVYLTLLFLLFRLGYQTFRMATGFEKMLSAFFIAYLTSASVMSLATGNFTSPRCWLILGIFGGLLANVRGRLTYYQEQ